MKFATPMFLIFVTACGSNIEAPQQSDLVAGQTIQRPGQQEAPTVCSWGTNVGGTKAPDDATPPDPNNVNWYFQIPGSAVPGFHLPSDFTPFNFDASVVGGNMWVHYQTTDVDDVESCPDYITNGSTKLTFYTGNYLLFITATWTDPNGLIHQVQWGGA